MPSVGECRAFFGHFARGGRPSFNGPRSILRPDYPGRASPDSEPRGTVAILCEIAIDRVAAHDREGASGQDLASTATVRHASSQIAPCSTAPKRRVPTAWHRSARQFLCTNIVKHETPARWCLDFAAQGRGPKLVFLHAFTALAAAAAQYQARAPNLAVGERNPADPYMIAVPYSKHFGNSAAQGASSKTR